MALSVINSANRRVENLVTFSSWHIKQINLKLSKGIGVLYKLRHLVPKQSLKTLYSSFIQSYVLYGILNWGCANKTTLEPTVKHLKIFNFDKLYLLETAKMIYQISSDKTSLEGEFEKNKKCTQL